MDQTKIEHACLVLPRGLATKCNSAAIATLLRGAIIYSSCNNKEENTGIFTESAPGPRPIQSSSRDVHMCNIVYPPADDRNQESWRLLVKERIANIGRRRRKHFSLYLNDFCGFY